MTPWKLLSAAFIAAAAFMQGAKAQQVSPVVGFPSDEPGIQLGVSACYAGRIGQWIVAAGGCNFPSPGNKKYYDGIYAARISRHALHWKRVGTLPHAAAYGVAVASGDSLLLMGGTGPDGNLCTTLSIHLNASGTQAAVRSLTPLPLPVDNAAVARSGRNVYVVGGNHDGRPSADVLHCRLGSAPIRWSRLGTMPGAPRVQPVATACRGKVYVWGGFHAAADSSRVHTRGLCLDTGTGEWHALGAPLDADGREATLAGGAAWADGRRIYATGGVDKDIFLDAISGRYRLVEPSAYAHQSIGWYRFGKFLFTFDTKKGSWRPATFSSASLARAGAAAVPVTGMGCFYIGGEVKPTLRTPQIVLVKP